MRRGHIIRWLVISFFFVSALALPRRVFCYDTNIAHPNIAQMAGLLFNKNSDQKLTAEEIGWIMDGAREEDTPTRWVNHFYDPIHNVGLKNVQLSAKKWSENAQAQTQFSLGDKSWQRALADWRKGDKEKAFKELGHTVHLVSDMLVPAHTRDDIHVVGDSYEQFVKDNWNSLYSQIKPAISTETGTHLIDFFDNSAEYSNENFYSDDTVEDSRFSIKKTSMKYITYKGATYKFFVVSDKNKINYNLYFSKDVFSWQDSMNNIKLDNFGVKHDLVLTDYSLHLIPKAIAQSAGVVQLFFAEANKNNEQTLPIARVAPKGYIDRALGFVVSAGEDLLGYVKSRFGGNNTAIGQGSGQIVTEPVNSDPLSSEPSVENPKLKSPVKIVKVEKKDPLPSTETPSPVVQELVLPKVQSSLPFVPSSTSLGVSYGNGGGSYSSVGGIPEQNPVVPPVVVIPTSTPPTSTPPVIIEPPPVPLFDPFFSQIIFTTSSEYNIFGTCSTNTSKILVTSSSIEISPSSTIWSFPFLLSSGHNYFSFAAVGVDYVTSTYSEPVHIIQDNDPPPTPVINTEELKTVAGFKINLIGADALSPTFYDLYYQPVSPTPTTTWQAIATSTVVADIEFPTARGDSYIFRARAFDILGNTSPWSDEIVSSTPIRLDWRKDVVINEIAWAGTIDDSFGRADEWIELFNNTDQDIDLNNWRLKVADRDIIFTTSTTIAANGFFLWERTDDSAVQNITADSTSTLQYGLKNTGEYLNLVDSTGEIVDEVDCSSGGWFAGSNTSSTFRSMARISSKITGNDKINWQTSRGPWIEALAYDKFHLVYGSPKTSNSQTMQVLAGTQNITDLILTKENGPYFLVNYTLPAGATLHIDPGVEIYLPQYGYFFVNGNLTINGSADAPVIFQPAPSSTRWANVVFTDAIANIQYANFLRGGLEPRTINDGVLYFSNSTATLDHVSIWNSRTPGKNINSKNSNIIIKNSSIGADVKYPNSGVPDVDTVGIRARGGELNLENILFTNLIFGVDGGSPVDNLPKLQVNNIPPENFSNVDYPWQPANWLEMIIPTSTATSTP